MLTNYGVQHELAKGRTVHGKCLEEARMLNAAKGKGRAVYEIIRRDKSSQGGLNFLTDSGVTLVLVFFAHKVEQSPCTIVERVET
mmetsp:Transcript_4139/g.8118  ORF Transcript_4139/g.8118 Transcript_4139/m.8118 type:complete len:85 (+) Transcript_4139:82-336(+)